MTDQTSGDVFGGVLFRHEQSRQFAAHMMALPLQEFCPLRSAFDPLHIPDFLPRIILRERVVAATFVTGCLAPNCNPTWATTQRENWWRAVSVTARRVPCKLT